jgi:hypothetical protein
VVDYRPFARAIDIDAQIQTGARLSCDSDRRSHVTRDVAGAPHIMPSDADNLRLPCHAHNRLAAELV